MKKPKNRFGYLLAGMFIGILIAFSIIWWQGNDIGRWSIIKKSGAYFSNIFGDDSNHSTNIIFKNTEDSGNKIIQGKLTDPALISDSAYYDTTNINLYDPNALDEFLAKYCGLLPDSLVLDSIIKSQNNLDINFYNTASDIQVKKDKLIYAKTYKVPGISTFDAANPDITDSLLTDNISNLQKNKNTLRVEFWKSPINYKGYKTGVNKLILFGIDQYDMISFKIMNNILYMKYMSDYYPLESTSGFEKFIPVNNPRLLSQLNSK